MFGNLELFSSLDKSVTSNVALGNNNQVNVMGKGTVDILSQKWEKKVINYVFYVVGLKQDLMGIG